MRKGESRNGAQIVFRFNHHLKQKGKRLRRKDESRALIVFRFNHHLKQKGKSESRKVKAETELRLFFDLTTI
jgi:hypothetical protein